MKRTTDGDRHEAWVQYRPDGYRINVLRARGVYDRAEAVTFDSALRKAKELYNLFFKVDFETDEQTSTSKPVMIHAYRGVYQSHVFNYQGKDPQMTILITNTYDDAADQRTFELFRYTDRQAAELAGVDLKKSAKDPSKVTTLIVDGPDDLATAAGPYLVLLFRHLRRDPFFSKFTDLATARRRVWEALEFEQGQLPVLSAPAVPSAGDAPPNPNADVHKDEEHTMANKKAKKEGGRKRASYPDGAKITILAETNPKRKGSEAAKRFDYYKNGMLVTTALEKGVTAADLKYDTANKYISIG